jgi:hypothetical protein
LRRSGGSGAAVDQGANVLFSVEASARASLKALQLRPSGAVGLVDGEGRRFSLTVYVVCATYRIGGFELPLVAPWVPETARPGHVPGLSLCQRLGARASRAEMSVTTWDKYIDYAERCLAVARATGSRESRIALREMASAWTMLASTLDRDERPVA